MNFIRINQRNYFICLGCLGETYLKENYSIINFLNKTLYFESLQISTESGSNFCKVVS